MKTLYLLGLGCLLYGCGATPHNADRPYTIAAYYFPNYHVDKRNENVHGTGWTEWELVKRAQPKFDGHEQPKVPAWGYTDEADPRAMAQKIQAANAYGVDAFIFDWYYYDDGPFLERALEEGFMEADNNDLVKFGLMWANHDWEDIHPYTSGTDRRLLYPGKITPETWDRMTDYIVATYFSHPSYWLVDGAPYFSVYDLTRFIEIFGSLSDTRMALDRFRDKARKAGFPDINLNAVVWGRTVLPSEEVVRDPAALLQTLGFDSFTSYVWTHHVDMKQFPATSYDSVSTAYMAYAEKAVTEYPIPYYPNVTMGWDASPRTNQQTAFENVGYPYMPLMVGNTPEAFGHALERIKSFVDKQPSNEKIITVNCWNEWTEGSYLEPDTRHGMAYLERIRSIFGRAGSAPDPKRSASTPSIKTVTVLGNSIVEHAPSNAIGWSGHWGMAASVRDSDFVHILTRNIQRHQPDVKVNYRNIADFERSFSGYDLSQLADLKDTDMLIVKLSENVEAGKEADFIAAYQQLLDYVAPSGIRIVVDGFWANELNGALAAFAADQKLSFVSIADLAVRDSTNMAIGKFDDPHVARHPSDKGMRNIADRIWTVVRYYF